MAHRFSDDYQIDMIYGMLALSILQEIIRKSVVAFTDLLEKSHHVERLALEGQLMTAAKLGIRSPRELRCDAVFNACKANALDCDIRGEGKSTPADLNGQYQGASEMLRVW